MCWFIEHLPRMGESNPEWHIYTSGKDGKFTLYIFQTTDEKWKQQWKNILYKIFIFRGLRGTSVAYMLTEKWNWLHVSRERLCQNKQAEQFPNLTQQLTPVQLLVSPLTSAMSHVFWFSYKKWRYLMELSP